MRFMPPDRNITLYEEGFGAKDILGRADFGRKLSELVEKVDDPLVIVLDGEWGTGKSFFLRSWVGAHNTENSGQALTVFFDAFQYDFIDEPLIGLTSAIADRLPAGSGREEAWKRAKAAAARLWRPAVRVGLAMTTAGASEAAGAVLDAGFSGAEKEIGNAVDGFWKREAGRRGAMAQFKETLSSISNDQKLVIVVDELDRCRPDYALNVLETIKHFFNVDNVHFILGVNIKKLSDTVKYRYGLSTNSNAYLEKFVSLRVRLPTRVGPGLEQHSTILYFKKLAGEMMINKSFVEDIENYLNRIVKKFPISLRSIRRILSQMAITPVGERGYEGYPYGYRKIISGLILIKYMNQELYFKIVSGTADFADVQSMFNVEKEIGSKMDPYSSIINYIWGMAMNEDVSSIEQDSLRVFGILHSGFSRESLSKIADEYVEVFQLR